jgi:uncharacterized phage-associated protein
MEFLMAHSAKAVANEFLVLAKEDGKQLTPMQLQKLVYFAYGWYLAITGERLLDERVEAWQWGPVIPSLYSEFKRFGSGPITDLAMKLVSTGSGISYRPYRVASDNPSQDAVAMKVIRKIWEIYGRFSASQLSSMTHAPGSPWSLTPEKDVRGTDIPDDVIKTYFERLANAG